MASVPAINFNADALFSRVSKNKAENETCHLQTGLCEATLILKI